MSILSSMNDELLMGLAAVSTVLLVVAIRRFPVAGIGLWLGVVCLVPVWIGTKVNGIFLPMVVLLGAVCLVSLMDRRPLVFRAVDMVALVLPLLYCLALMLGMARIADGVTLFAYWLLGYFLGRVAALQLSPDTLYRTVSILFAMVAVLAIVEFLTGENVFVRFLSASNSQYQLWGVLQPRGGFVRVEGAFGHSIALGACLALSLPLTVAARFPLWVRGLFVVLSLTAVMLTLSRIGIITCILALVLSVVFMPSDLSVRVRTTFLGILGVVSVLAYPMVNDAFLKADEEAAGSAAYRADLLSLLPHMRPLGVSQDFLVTPDGHAYFGDFRSIDSALILMGLSYGWVPLLLATVMLVGAVVVVLRWRATPPTVAIVAQLPGLATVALITQFSIFFWFMAGVAVTMQVAAQATARSTRLVGQSGLVNAPGLSLKRLPPGGRALPPRSTALPPRSIALPAGSASRNSQRIPVKHLLGGGESHA